VTVFFWAIPLPYEPYLPTCHSERLVETISGRPTQLMMSNWKASGRSHSYVIVEEEFEEELSATFVLYLPR
jgi:hypothetical protein